MDNSFLKSVNSLADSIGRVMYKQGAPSIDYSVGALTDKRNRNPNWTDGEIIRFLEILQEEDTLRDLMAQRNKQVFCYVAGKLCSEGAEKTWDQCRIKLKNLKSQYRYVKERIPYIVNLNLEDDETMKRLISDCQSRGISPSSLKHLRYLRRFLNRMTSLKAQGPYGSLEETDSVSLGGGSGLPTLPGMAGEHSSKSHQREDSNSVFDQSETVSPPSTPYPSRNLKILTDDSDDNRDYEPENKRPRLDSLDVANNLSEGNRFIERFNQEMMEQFLEHQRQMQGSIHQWEMDRQRQHEIAMDRWRQEAREHEKQMFGMFVQVMSECNNALTNMLKVKVKQTEQNSPGSRSSSKFSRNLDPESGVESSNTSDSMENDKLDKDEDST
ncbi:hypothetical protein TCAL_08366 [Tigriopus californicus]|uniref:Myb/SANT-like DNA-binding domain-containing protein n=1 Tax=Tigriopus californicus TaxID=6832 RepID=A0A553PCM8_TIGCA|nr:zinc finger and SCAN domain-containing protein 20-like [Tigriopus californicus]XP_059098860.1 zinc finger and SCAN domain-containing protein 20-like [Tigriopus californicus]TRY75447.1 hypothetical protein TCAL_08366 [Tigriopus californicus]|eukprot:TCALIF_08366-PA protein Name:"Protein of unknown function" AED:0.00 eAED:0.00 QI:663/1/1/1/0.8/0.66/6/1689/383